MTPPHGSPAWPPPWGQIAEPMERTLGRLLERSDRLLERSEITADRVARISTDVHAINHRLALGDKRMDELQKSVESLSPKPEAQMAAWERITKVLTPYIILPIAAWATGSWQVAVEILKAISGR